MQPLVDTCLHAVALLVQAKQFLLLNELDPDLTMLYTDQTKLRRMLTYLLRNAVQFTGIAGVGSTFTVTLPVQYASLERKE